MIIHSRPEMMHSRPEVIHAHQSAPTQFVEANGIRFAYRRFGKSGGVPLVFNQHFTGTMDHWDPAVTDGFATDREVILFDNAGVASSSGVPDENVPRWVVRTDAGLWDTLAWRTSNRNRFTPLARIRWPVPKRVGEVIGCGRYESCASGTK